MTEDQIIDSFVALFRGRGDCYGSAKGFCVHKPLTRATFETHLRSTNPEDHIGVYCMVGEQCSWGCIDIDGKDFPIVHTTQVEPATEAGLGREIVTHIEHDWQRMTTLAKNLEQVLYVKGIIAHIERSKNGFHVWVFPDQPLVPASAMRRALMAACKAVGYDPKEVNPKAEGPRPGTKGLGNFVRLPYGGCLTEARQDRVFVLGADVEGANTATLQQWSVMGPRRTPLANLEAVAALWTPPPMAHHEVDYDAGLDDDQLMLVIKLLDGKAFTIWKDGPLPGSDRSTTLARLAHLCAEHGLTATHTFAVIKSADVRWGGKFANRPDGLEQMARIVGNAYERYQ